MKVWKRNAVVAAVVLFVCAAVYLNWTYQSGETADAGKMGVCIKSRWTTYLVERLK